MNETITLELDQLQELRRLLGTVEDRLLHTSFEMLDLGGFLAGLGWSAIAPEQLVTRLISDLSDKPSCCAAPAPTPPPPTRRHRHERADQYSQDIQQTGQRIRR